MVGQSTVVTLPVAPAHLMPAGVDGPTSPGVFTCLLLEPALSRQALKVSSNIAEEGRDTLPSTSVTRVLWNYLQRGRALSPLRQHAGRVPAPLTLNTEWNIVCTSVDDLKASGDHGIPTSVSEGRPCTGVCSVGPHPSALPLCSS